MDGLLKFQQSSLNQCNQCLSTHQLPASFASALQRQVCQTHFKEQPHLQTSYSSLHFGQHEKAFESDPMEVVVSMLRYKKPALTAGVIHFVEVYYNGLVCLSLMPYSLSSTRLFYSSHGSNLGSNGASSRCGGDSCNKAIKIVMGGSETTAC
jgi:hypothetical protein